MSESFHSHSRVYSISINERRLKRFPRGQRIIFLLAHMRDLGEGLNKYSDLYPVLKKVESNHNMLPAEIYEEIYRLSSSLPEDERHFQEKIKKINNVLERTNAACYVEHEHPRKARKLRILSPLAAKKKPRRRPVAKKEVVEAPRFLIRTSRTLKVEKGLRKR